MNKTNTTQNTQILKVIVGSRAHGTFNADSDTDYRAVYVQPTAEILSLGAKYKGTHWVEGDKEDNTAWELGHFLHLATHSNPTILEVFLAPSVSATDLGLELRKLFPYVWSSTNVMNAFIGYSLNQRKKFLERKDLRPAKYATAYLRTLYNGYELLKTGTFTINIMNTPAGLDVLKYKQGKYESVGAVIDKCDEWETKLKEAYDAQATADKLHETNYDKVNEFLLKVRKANL